MAQQNIAKEARRVVEGGEADQKAQSNANRGDNRTPNQAIGQVKYADHEGGHGPRNEGESGSASEPKKESRAND